MLDGRTERREWATVVGLRRRSQPVHNGNEGKLFRALGSTEVWSGFLAQLLQHLGDERLRFGVLTNPANTDRSLEVSSAPEGGTKHLAPTRHLCSL